MSFYLLSIFATQTLCKFFQVGIRSIPWRIHVTVSWKPQIFWNCFDSRLFAMLMDSSVSIHLPRIVRSSSFEKFIFLFLIISPGAVYLRFYQQFERYFYMKITVTIIPKDLVTNSLWSSFCLFLLTKSKNQVFSKLVVC